MIIEDWRLKTEMFKGKHPDVLMQVSCFFIAVYTCKRGWRFDQDKTFKGINPDMLLQVGKGIFGVSGVALTTMC